MSNRTAVANGADPIQQQAASDSNAVQDACNLVAVVGCFIVICSHCIAAASVAMTSSTTLSRWRSSASSTRCVG